VSSAEEGVVGDEEEEEEEPCENSILAGKAAGFVSEFGFEVALL
jgi:hypothetical protein